MGTPTKVDSQVMASVDVVLGTMATHYGARFADMWRDVDPAKMRAAWGYQLGRLRTREIQRGLGSLDQCKFPPTLPEFIALCRPTSNLEDCFHEAVEQMRRRHLDGSDRWSDPAVYLAAVRMGGDLQRLPYAAAKGRWRQIVKRVEQDLDSGEAKYEVPPAPRAIRQDDGQRSPMPPAVKRKLAELLQLGQGSGRGA